MKNILLIALLLVFTVSNAQDSTEPKFEKQADRTEATYYHDNGSIEQSGFFNKLDNLHGTWTSYDVEGNKVAIGEYDNGKKVGKWIFIAENSIREVDYMNNVITSVSEWKSKQNIAIAD